MFKRGKVAVAAVAASVFLFGIAAQAQVRPARERPNITTRQQAVKERMQRARKSGQQSEAQALRVKQRAAVQGNLRGLIALPNPRVMQRAATALALTDEQKEQIKQLYKQFAETTKPVRKQRIEALKAFATAFRDPKVGRAELDALAEPVLQAERAIIGAQLDFWISLRGVLTPDQQAKLQAIVHRAGQAMRDRRVAGQQATEKSVR